MTIAKVRIARMALDNTTPEQRPAILKTLPPIFRAIWSGPRLPIGRNDEPK